MWTNSYRETKLLNCFPLKYIKLCVVCPSILTCTRETNLLPLGIGELVLFDRLLVSGSDSSSDELSEDDVCWRFLLSEPLRLAFLPDFFFLSRKKKFFKIIKIDMFCKCGLSCLVFICLSYQIYLSVSNQIFCMKKEKFLKH